MKIKYMMLIAFFAISCSGISENKTVNLKKSAFGKNISAKEFVVLWNELINNRDWENLTQFYAESVYLFGKRKSRETVIDAKKAYFEENLSFQQKVSEIYNSKVLFTTQSVSFNKTYLNKSNNERKIESHFSIAKDEQGYWVILEETDAPTQKKATSITNCRNFWYGLFKSNQEIERYSESYSLFIEFRDDAIVLDVREIGEFTNPIIERYYFSLNNQKLYKSFTESNFEKEKSVNFDKNLLNKVNEFCK